MPPDFRSTSLLVTTGTSIQTTTTGRLAWAGTQVKVSTLLRLTFASVAGCVLLNMSVSNFWSKASTCSIARTLQFRITLLGRDPYHSRALDNRLRHLTRDSFNSG